MTNNHLTLVWLTNRKNCKFEWFAQSLAGQVQNDFSNIRIVAVDFWAQPARDGSWTQLDVDKRSMEFRNLIPAGYRQIDFIHIPPKPSVWQGPYRLTAKDYFAPANARNTGLCHAKDGWIAFADDQAVLMPGWFDAVQTAMMGDYIVFGAYKKVKRMEVENGVLKSFEPFPPGVDSRWQTGNDQRPVSCAASLLFGCSFAMPVGQMVRVGGMDEMADPTGGEDYMLGIRLKNAGWSDFRYDRRMLTLESEDLAGQEPAFIRVDPGSSPNDRSHALLHHAQQTAKAGHVTDIANLREVILEGGEFPIPDGPTHEFFTGLPLASI